MDVLNSFIVAVISQWVRVSAHRIVHFKYIQFIYQVYLNKAAQNKLKDLNM